MEKWWKVRNQALLKLGFNRKMKSMLLVVASAVVVVALAAADDGCWRTAYARGTGKTIKSCDSDEELSKGLCYPKCKDGFKGRGSMCNAICPSVATVSFDVRANELQMDGFYRTGETTQRNPNPIVVVPVTGPKKAAKTMKIRIARLGVLASGSPNVKKDSTTFCVVFVNLMV